MGNENLMASMSTSTAKYAIEKIGQYSLAALFAFTALAWFVVAYEQGQYQFLLAVTLTFVSIVAVAIGALIKKVV